MSSEIVSSAGIVGTYVDPMNDRFRGLAPQFAHSVEEVDAQWRWFTDQIDRHPKEFTRYTLRMVAATDAAAQLALATEAFIPLTEEAGLLYLAANAPERRASVPIPWMRATIDGIAQEIAGRFRTPASRLAELHDRGYRFVDHVIDPAGLTELWSGGFGWDTATVNNLSRRLEDNAQREPDQRDLWFTGSVYNGRLVAAALAERLDVPGPDGPLATIESTEWMVDRAERHAGVATAMLALNTAQCLEDRPDATMIAECRFDNTAYAAGLSIGFVVPSRRFGQQILERNVLVEGQLADFVPLHLPPSAVQSHYAPEQRAAMLQYVSGEGR